MTSYIISGESTTDFTFEKFKEIDVEYIGCHFYLDGKEYYDDLGQSLPHEKFYKILESGAKSSTAAIAIGDYAEYFRSFLSKGKDLIHLTLTSGLSSTIEAAKLAAEQVQIEYPNRKIYIVDSMCCSPGFGMLLEEMSRMRLAGKSIEQVFDWVEQNKLRMHHEFLTTDLTYFIRGGRVSPVAGFIGNVLGICPIMTMDSKGHLIPYEKARSVKKGLNRIIQHMQDLADNGIEYADEVMVCHSNCPDIADLFVEKINQHFKNVTCNIESYCIGPTVGSHTGTGTVAVFFWGKERTAQD